MFPMFLKQSPILSYLLHYVCLQVELCHYKFRSQDDLAIQKCLFLNAVLLGKSHCQYQIVRIAL